MTVKVVFREDGMLFPGKYRMTGPAFRKQFGRGPRRAELMAGLGGAILALRRAGCRTLYVNGSFVTDNPRPNDYDACWDEAGMDYDLLDPVLLDASDSRAAQKFKFRGELFPAHEIANDRGLMYIDFFQLDRFDQPKGIIELDLEEWE